MSIELLDPAEITVRNIRQAKPGQRLIDSIREHGILQPIAVIREPDGTAQYLRLGGNRLEACIQLGIQVPAIVVTRGCDTTEDEIDRIFKQIDENDARESLNAAVRASAVQELLDLGVEPAAVTRKTGYSKAEIAAARKVAASVNARTVAAQYPLDLEQAAAVAEFDGDADAVGSLVDAAGEGHGRFAHALQQARDARADRQALEAHAAKLAKRGITVTGETQNYEYMIDYWADAAGSQLTPKTHRACPGNVVRLSVYYSRNVQERWYCTDPKGNGHKRYHGSSGSSQSPEEAAAERKRVLVGNKAWRSAEKVRRSWLREFLARPKIPDGGLLYALEAFARSGGHLRYAMDHRSDGQHVTARGLLGLPKGEGGWSAPPEVYTAMTKASPARAQVIALGIVLGASEGATSVHSWRQPDADTAEYLEALAGWGYELSDVELELVTAARAKQAEQAAAAEEAAAAAGEAGT